MAQEELRKKELYHTSPRSVRFLTPSYLRNCIESIKQRCFHYGNWRSFPNDKRVFLSKRMFFAGDDAIRRERHYYLDGIETRTECAKIRSRSYCHTCGSFTFDLFESADRENITEMFALFRNPKISSIGFREGTIRGFCGGKLKRAVEFQSPILHQRNFSCFIFYLQPFGFFLRSAGCMPEII